ncbi:MAG: site-specific integrase [Thermoplasmatales archaeon]|nr:MAG: site-specific integrase [Thermoplasmatales archaeon]
MVNDKYENIQENFSRFNCPIILNPREATFNDVALHASLRQRLSPSTVEKRMRYARFMENHIVPVDFRNPSFENFVRHMDYREQIEFGNRKGSSALSHEWKTMKMFLRAYGLPIWDYKPPLCPRSKARIVFLPDKVYEMIHRDYCKDDYENALIQYTLLHSYMVGWRNPSELCIMSVDDVKLDEELLIITEPKKYNSTRIVAPGYSIINSKTRKSFKNWIDHWRPKVVNQYSGDALYLKSDGCPINIDSYRMFITRRLKKIYPDFQLYSTRHWCAIGKLIQSKLETGKFDEYLVMNWLGHSQIQTTMSYLREAEHYKHVANYNWFKRVLRYYNGNFIIEESTGKSKQREKTVVLTKISPRKGHGPAQI